MFLFIGQHNNFLFQSNAYISMFIYIFILLLPHILFKIFPIFFLEFCYIQTFVLYFQNKIQKLIKKRSYLSCRFTSKEKLFASQLSNADGHARRTWPGGWGASHCLFHTTVCTRTDILHTINTNNQVKIRFNALIVM